MLRNLIEKKKRGGGIAEEVREGRGAQESEKIEKIIGRLFVTCRVK